MKQWMPVAALALCAGAAGPAAAGDYLLGDWGGARQSLADRGLEFEAVVGVDVLANVDGGIDEGVETPAILDAVATLDTAAAGWWRDGTFSLHVIGLAGGDFSTERSGDAQVVSNIEAPNTVTVLEAWYEHRFAEDRFSILAGLHGINSEFYVTEHGGIFLNSSFGIGPEVAQAGVSIFPVTALGLRLKFAPTEGSYALAAIYDGIPGDPGDRIGTHVILDHGDGVFAIGEVGLTGTDGYWKVGVGGWYHTAEFDDYAGIPRDDNGGVYLVGEKDLWRDAESGRGVGAFVQVGFADEDRNQLDRYVGAGLNATGLLPGRPQDVAGIAVAHAENGDGFRRATPGMTGAETAIELTYLVAPLPWLTVQPDLQYIVNPGTDAALDDALVLGVRLQVSL